MKPMSFNQKFYIDYIFITFKSATPLLVGVALGADMHDISRNIVVWTTCRRFDHVILVSSRLGHRPKCCVILVLSVTCCWKCRVVSMLDNMLFDMSSEYVIGQHVVTLAKGQMTCCDDLL